MLKTVLVLFLFLDIVWLQAALKSPYQQLIRAIKQNNEKKIDSLLKNSNIDLNSLVNGHCPLHVATSRPETSPMIVQKLIYYGADTNLKTHYTNFSNHPLFGNNVTPLHLLMIEAHAIMSSSSYKDHKSLQLNLQSIDQRLQVLLFNQTTNINALDDKRRTPLDIITSVIIGEDQKSWAASERITNLNHCCTCKFFKASLIALLLKYGAKKYEDREYSLCTIL